MPARATPAAADPLRVTVRRIIARPVAEVFRAWITPEQIAQWISPGMKGIKVIAEPRTGGRFRIELTYRGAPWVLDGTFLEVEPNRRLRFSWITTECPAAVHSVVTVEFRARGARTELLLLHEGFPDEATRSDHDATGWQQIVEVFVAAAGEELSAAGLERAADQVAGSKRGDSYRVEVRKVIARPAEEVFAAWTGKFPIDMLGSRGKIRPHDGEYLEIDPPHRLVFSWISSGENGCAEPIGSVVTLDFHARGGQTEMVLVHSGFPSAKSRDDHQIGWTEMLMQLA